MRSRSVVNVPSSSSTLVNLSLPRFSCLFAILKLLPCSMTLWIVVALCFLRSLRCFLRISLLSSVASIFSLAVVGVLRFLLFSMKFFVSSENLLFLLVLLFHFLPAPISGSVMLLFISFKGMLLLLSSCYSSRAAYRFCRSILNSFTICLHTLSGSGFE